jgi:AraC family carnitine catabolism transcriptional activator
MMGQSAPVPAHFHPGGWTPAAGPARSGMRERTVSERRRMYLRACALIEHGYRRPLTLSAVATILAISPRQLQRVFAQFGKRTFREELMWRRMTAAVELLARPALPLAEIPALVGYRRSSQFARTFRHHYGVSPSAYRRALVAGRREP